MNKPLDYTKEIEKISKQIVKEPANISLYIERADLYKKLQRKDKNSDKEYYEKKYEEDKNKIFSSIPTTVKDIFLQAEYFIENREYKRAISGYTRLINKGKNIFWLYYERGLCYEKIEEWEDAFNDFDIVISNITKVDNIPEEDIYRHGAENAFETKKYSKALNYFQKLNKCNPNYPKINIKIAKCHFHLNNYNDAFKKVNQILKSDPNDYDSNILLGNIYSIKEQFDKAINIYSQAIEIDPGDKTAYHLRGYIYAFKLGETVKAQNDYKKAVEILYDESSIEIPFLHCLDLDQKYFDLLSECIKIGVDSSESYLLRGILYYNIGNEEKVIEDLNNAFKLNERIFYINEYLIELDDLFGDEFVLQHLTFLLKIKTLNIFDKLILLAHRAFIYGKIGKDKKAISDLTKLILINKESAEAYCYRSIRYFKQNILDLSLKDLSLFKKYSKDKNNYSQLVRDVDCVRYFFQETVAESTINYFIKSVELLLDLKKIESYKKQKNYFIKLSDLNNFSEYPQKGFNKEFEEFLKEIFRKYPYENFISELKNVPSDFFNIQQKRYISEYLIHITKKEREKPFERKDDIFYYEMISNLNEIEAHISNEIQRKIAYVKIEERDRIIRNQAHDIKNIISTIINPLMILKRITKNPQIDRALKQAEILSKMVNAVSLSYSGSEKDFYYDAKHNSEGMSLKDMITSSVEASIGNIMQIVKYYKPFWEQYFPQYDLYEKALAEYTRLHEETDNKIFGLLIKFLRKYMFDIVIEFGDSDALIIGDKKGSDVKLLTLFNEIIFNAIKYTAFVKKEDRIVSIKFNSSQEFISLEVENSLSGDTEVKSVGTGNLIIDNIVNIIKGKVSRSKLNNRFITKIQFPNFWEENNNGKDIVC